MQTKEVEQIVEALYNIGVKIDKLTEEVENMNAILGNALLFYPD